MTNLLPKESDIAIIGGGSAGLALAFHLADQGSGNLAVTIIEARHDYQNDRTWCFWDFDELHATLQPSVRKKWQSWSFSSKQETIVHNSVSHPYCAVSAGDYYQIVLASMNKNRNFSLVKGCRAESITASGGGYLISTSHGDLLSKYVIDTRPPIRNYHYKKSSSSLPLKTSRFSGAILYQIFFGVEVELENDCFDDSTVQLMTDLSEEHDGLAFSYVLPYSAKRALVEYTTFTPLFFAAQQLRDHSLDALKRRIGQQNYNVIYEEGAILPMGFPGVKSSQRNILNAGILGGSIRDSTGYAFIRTQRWAARCAAELIKGNMPKTMGCDSRVDENMDKIFLKVLRKKPHLSPNLFMDLARNLSADAFARFMMEKSTLPDYMKVILAMPKKPFIQQIYTTS